MGKEILAVSVEMLADRKVSVKLAVDCSKNDLTSVLGQIIATALLHVEHREHKDLSVFELGAAVSYDSAYVTEHTSQALEDYVGAAKREEFRRGMIAGVAMYAREKTLLESENENVTWQ